MAKTPKYPVVQFINNLFSGLGWLAIAGGALITIQVADAANQVCRSEFGSVIPPNAEILAFYREPQSWWLAFCLSPSGRPQLPWLTDPSRANRRRS